MYLERAKSVEILLAFWSSASAFVTEFVEFYFYLPMTLMAWILKTETVSLRVAAAAHPKGGGCRTAAPPKPPKTEM
jgi:hypothetical protein